MLIAEKIRIQRRQKIIIFLIIFLLSIFIFISAWASWWNELNIFEIISSLSIVPSIAFVYFINLFLAWDVRPELENEKVDSSFYFYFKIILHLCYLTFLFFLLLRLVF